MFGSRATGTYNDGSDIDLALMGVDLVLNDILDATIKIEMLLLPYKFDIIIYDRIKNTPLIEHINRVGIIIYNSENPDPSIG